jgi:NitT/TauT family transport system substrate-binding protein
MRSYCWILAIFVAAALPLADRPAAADVMATIRVAGPPTADVAPLIYAMRNGMFAKAGINVDFTLMSTGSAVSQGVAGGAIDIGYSALTALIAGHSRGIPFVLVAPGGMYQSSTPDAFMVVRKDSPLKNGRDFAGKTIGVPSLRDLDGIATSAWVDQNGGNSQSLKFVELPSPAMLPALLDGRIDAFTNANPWITLAIDSGNVRVLSKSLDSIAPRFLITAWFANASYVDKNRDVLTRFERVLQDAAISANAHRADMIPLMASYTKLDPALIARMPHDFDSSDLDPALIQPMIDASAKYHAIEKSFDARDFISPTALSSRRG